MSRWPEREFDFSPLDQWMRENVKNYDNFEPGGVHAVLRTAALRQTFYRAKAAGSLHFIAADRLALALGAMPQEIWSDWYDVALRYAPGP